MNCISHTGGKVIAFQIMFLSPCFHHEKFISPTIRLKFTTAGKGPGREVPVTEPTTQHIHTHPRAPAQNPLPTLGFWGRVGSIGS